MISGAMDLERLSSQESKPAPGPLLAVQAFANTLDVEEGTDRLESTSSLREWLLHNELASPGLEVGSRDLSAARELRDAIRAQLDANGHGENRPGRRLALPAEGAAVVLVAGADGSLDLDLAPAPSVEAFAAQILGIVYRAQLTGEWARLKLCECDECAWAFFDGSRNRSGSWCRMEVCGNRIKNREYRRRHAAR